MKQRLTGLLLASLWALLCPAQKSQFSGSFFATGEDASNAVFYTNILQVTVSGDQAIAEINVKAGPKSEPEDFFTFKGTLKGTLTPDNILVKGTVHMSLIEASGMSNNLHESDAPGELSGTGSNGVITGTLYVTVDGEKQSNLQFTLRTEEIAPVLLFPLGKSPKVFDKGWLFGAEFKVIDPEGNKETDLSDKIEWSGTGNFEPDIGASSRPSFNAVGENKIILTVEYEGKKYKKEYPVITVDADSYARVGSMAKCGADAHGFYGDPMHVLGPVITGNGNVLINGLPTACEGDRGIHVACSGTNTFTIAHGDPDVRINGKKVASLDYGITLHCGGIGRLFSLEGLTSKFSALSSDVTFTDNNGKKITPGSKPKSGTKMITGPKGLVMMSPDKNTVMMILPNTNANIISDDGTGISIFLENGSIMLNGEKADSNRNLVIESFNERLVRKGTRFIYTINKDNSRLIVYEGEVDLFLKKENRKITITAGKVYNNDFTYPYTISDTTRFQAADVLVTIPKDSAYWQLPVQGVGNDDKQVSKSDFISLLKKYWIAGALILVLLLILLILKKRNR